MLLAGDSQISLCWTIYENNKLDVFVRNRVINVRTKVPLENLHWVEGTQNLADTGTRPDVVNAATVHPTSEWSTGKDWMRLSYDGVLNSGIVRKVSDIQLDHESKKKLNEGLLVEEDYVKEVKGFLVRVDLTSIEKVIKCEEESQYIY